MLKRISLHFEDYEGDIGCLASSFTNPLLLFSRPRGKILALGKQQIKCFLKAPPTLLSLAPLSIPRPVPPLTPALFPQCRAVCAQKEKSQVSPGQNRGEKLGAGAKRGTMKGKKRRKISKRTVKRGINSTLMRKEVKERNPQHEGGH